MSASEDSTRVLCVEGDPELGCLVREKLSARGFSVDVAASVSSGLDAFDDARHDLVAVDHRLPDCNGMEILEALAARSVSIPVGIVMAEGSSERLRSILLSVDELAAPGALDGDAMDRLDFAVGPGRTRRSWQARISPLRDVGGACIGVALVTRAITARAAAKSRLTVARSEVDAATRARSELIAGMSHELRTPLTAIIGYSEILRYEYFGPVNERQKQQLDIVLHCSNHLLDLINDILDICRIDSGATRLALQPANLHRLIVGALSQLRETADRRRMRLDYRPPPTNEELTLSIDEKRITQVLHNLLSNALKFTPDGGAVSVTVRREEGRVAISVSDSGLGIPPEERELIFEAFYQVRRASTPTPEGSGLGLFLAKRLVELHGGTIWAESGGEGMGSVFTFTLPAGDHRR